MFELKFLYISFFVFFSIIKIFLDNKAHHSRPEYVASSTVHIPLGLGAQNVGHVPHKNTQAVPIEETVDSVQGLIIRLTINGERVIEAICPTGIRLNKFESPQAKNQIVDQTGLVSFDSHYLPSQAEPFGIACAQILRVLLALYIE